MSPECKAVVRGYAFMFSTLIFALGIRWSMAFAVPAIAFGLLTMIYMPFGYALHECDGRWYCPRCKGRHQGSEGELCPSCKQGEVVDGE